MVKLIGLFFVVLILFLVAFSFVDADSWSAENPGGLDVQATQAANITATYGAEEYYLQLTAIASPVP